MDPVALVRHALGEDAWHGRNRKNGLIKPKVAEDVSAFQDLKVYRCYGATGQFEFRCLPSGSYCLLAANETTAVKLTRAGGELRSIIRSNWYRLLECDPLKLARLVLRLASDSRHEDHAVLADINAIRHYRDGYVVNEEEWSRNADRAGRTSIKLYSDTILLRALTLLGWMHEKYDLGVETVSIKPDGIPRFEPRQVLSVRTFTEVPFLLY
jgi:hypothetical protein